MIAVFAYDRPEFLNPCLKSLAGENVHLFVDAAGENSEVERICRESGFPVHAEKEHKGIGFQRHKALGMFLNDGSLGDDFMLCDSDLVFAGGSIELLRRELAFWWSVGVPVGMLCCGYQRKSVGWRVLERDGHGIIQDHGGEPVAMMTRQVLEKVGNIINVNMLGNTASLKNAMRRFGNGRAILVKPMPGVQHLGAFRTTLSPQWSPEDAIFRGLDGSVLNPRPDLFDVSLEQLQFADELHYEIREHS